MNIYETPEVRVMDLEVEGVLCQSGEFELWEREEIDW